MSSMSLSEFSTLLPSPTNIEDVPLGWWLTQHTKSFLSCGSLLNELILSKCSCNEMTANEFVYAWADETIVDPIKVTAQEYVSHLLKWTSTQLDNPAKFPQDSSSNLDLPLDFKSSAISPIFKSHIHSIPTSEFPIFNSIFTHYFKIATSNNLISNSEFEPILSYLNSYCKVPLPPSPKKLLLSVHKASGSIIKLMPPSSALQFDDDDDSDPFGDSEEDDNDSDPFGDSDEDENLKENDNPSNSLTLNLE